LLRDDLSVSDRTLKAVAAVEAAGVPFVIVTGRPVRWLKRAAADLGHRGIAVAANGALLYDLHTDSVLETFALAPEIGLATVRALREAVPGIAFAVERGVQFGVEPTYVRHFYDDDALVAPVEELLDAPVLKLLGRHEGYDADELLARALDVLGETVTVTHSFGAGLVEISAVGVSKATTLARVCAERGIAAHDVIAFGDMPNDLPLLAWAGHGVAVANAHPEVLAIADEITFGNDADGVAAVLERWFV
jgi:Cof subfamily protein (haloacid dehalogenase superfamily)